LLLAGLAAMFFLTARVAPQFGLHVPGHGEAAEAGQGVDEAKLWLLRGGLFVVGGGGGWLLAALVNAGLGPFFPAFNWVFDRATNVYGFVVSLFLRVSVLILLVYGGLIGLTVLGFRTVPVGFIPEQDKGYLVVNAQLPDGASLERSDDVIKRMTALAL